MTLNRYASFYDRFFYLLVILTICSTLPSFMSWEVGERLGFGITMVLVIEVSKTTVGMYLPLCSECAAHSS